MIILAFILFVCIVLAYASYAITQIPFSEVSLLSPFMPMIAEHAYRAVDLKAHFEYTELKEYESVMGMRRFDYFDHETVIRDDVHKGHMIEQFTRSLAKEMLESGLVEVVEQQMESTPWRKRVEMRVKVYQRER